MKKISIIVADDHAIVRQGTRKIFEDLNDFQILGEASNGKEALNLCIVKKPDILLLDLSMPDINGIEVLKLLKSKVPEQKIVIFTAQSDLQYVKAALKYGADGYLTKSVDSNQLKESLKKVANGEKIVSQDISYQLTSYLMTEKKGTGNLTSREYEIMLLVAKGKSNQDVAKELCIAVRTVETHVANILKKLKLVNRTQISSYAYENGLI